MYKKMSIPDIIKYAGSLNAKTHFCFKVRCLSTKKDSNGLIKYLFFILSTFAGATDFTSTATFFIYHAIFSTTITTFF